MTTDNMDSRERKQEHKKREGKQERTTGAMLERLGPELFQTESSATLHARREAERLGDTPPANALRAVADHASQALRDLQDLADARGMVPSRIGTMVGAMFSTIRNQVVDRVIDEERSYRGTLLGLRHGVDLVRMIRFVAAEAEDDDLLAWCQRWMEARSPLVDEVDAQMAWFARNPERAMQPARSLRIANN